MPGFEARNVRKIMSNTPEPELDLDLHFLPAWAQQSPAVNRFADFEGEPEGRFDRRRPDRDARRGPRDRGPRRGGPGDAPRGPGREPYGPPRQSGGPRQEFGRFRGQERERREPAMVLPEIDVAVLPEEKGVESLARQIKLTGRAYPLFDIGFLILKKPERYNVRFTVIKKPEGQVPQPLFLCAIDDTLWLSEQEAVEYVLNRHFATFYQAERIAGEPPKGVFTFVAQCGMSGTVLGPPNYHDYQTKLRKLHADRFSHMPFEVYKSRIKIVKDDAIVKKWVEEQSYSTEYVCLNVPDSLKLGTRQEVERHFRETHFANVIQSVETYTLSGTEARSLSCPPLQALARRAFEDQRRFPLQLVTTLSHMFASQGLQFFKVNKTLTHVAVSRPHYLDLSVTPVSDGIKQIINFINANPNTNRRKLLDVLAPAPPVEAAMATLPVSEGSAGAEAPTSEVSPQEAAPPTPEMNAVIRDLHWLIHQGHVIEFANGNLETAKVPIPRPVIPRAAKSPAKAPAPSEKASETKPEVEEIIPPTADTSESHSEPSCDVSTAASESSPAEIVAPETAPPPAAGEMAQVEITHPAPTQSATGAGTLPAI